MSKELAKLFASRFIARPDVKAVQLPDGKYAPDSGPVKGSHGRPLSDIHGAGFDMPSLLRHLNKESTYGHYLLNADNEAKVCVFDIDLEHEGNYVTMPGITEVSPFLENDAFDAKCLIYPEVNPRDLWKDRSALDARKWYKFQMMQLAHKFAKVVVQELGLPCATAYSGGKGVHVYAFTGKMQAHDVRAAGLLVMELLQDFQPTRGDNFFQHTNEDPMRGFQNFKIEVYPKQDSLEGKTLGNLVRLPMGKNQKSPDPTFFLDLKAPIWEMRPHPNPIELLTTGNPYV